MIKQLLERLNALLVGHYNDERFRAFYKAAKSGDPHAQYNLARFYSAVCDLEASAYWLNQSSRQGYLRAIIETEINNYDSDPEKSALVIKRLLPDLQKLAFDGDPDFEYIMGVIYYYGHGEPQDRKLGIEYIERAVEKGHGDAKLQTADFYFDSKLRSSAMYDFNKIIENLESVRESLTYGSIADFLIYGIYREEAYSNDRYLEKSIYYLDASAKKGNVLARARLGVFHYFGDESPYGHPAISKDARMARKLIKGSFNGLKVIAESNQQSNSIAIELLATIYLNGITVRREKKLAERILRHGAEQNMHYIQLLLGNFYAGEGRYQDAMVWLSAAASRLDDASYHLAQFLMNEVNPLRDVKSAIPHLKIAANEPNHHAQYQLSNLYFDGAYLERDSREGMHWLMEAAQGGNSRAQLDLAKRYFEGEGVNQNTVEAHRWANLASASGSPKATELKLKIERDMNAEQILEAESSARP